MISKEKLLKELNKLMELTDDNWGAKAVIMSLFNSMEEGKLDE